MGVQTYKTKRSLIVVFGVPLVYAFRQGINGCKQGKEGPILQNRLLRLHHKPIKKKLSQSFDRESFLQLRTLYFIF